MLDGRTPWSPTKDRRGRGRVDAGAPRPRARRRRDRGSALRLDKLPIHGDWRTQRRVLRSPTFPGRHNELADRLVGRCAPREVGDPDVAVDAARGRHGARSPVEWEDPNHTRVTEAKLEEFPGVGGAEIVHRRPLGRRKVPFAVPEGDGHHALVCPCQPRVYVRSIRLLHRGPTGRVARVEVKAKPVNVDGEALVGGEDGGVVLAVVAHRDIGGFVGVDDGRGPVQSDPIRNLLELSHLQPKIQVFVAEEGADDGARLDQGLDLLPLLGPVGMPQRVEGDASKGLAVGLLVVHRRVALGLLRHCEGLNRVECPDPQLKVGLDCGEVSRVERQCAPSLHDSAIPE
eukprot:m.459536 g.459536  ORF g.459536 m.459536 type:complete len:344 (+) comp21779_c0_seq1:84-1115(+)